MMYVELSEGISETLDILNHMDKKYTDKIPEKFKMFLEKNKSQTYVPNLDHTKKLNEINLKEKTKDILAIIYMNYWCTTEEKIEYSNLLVENKRKQQEKLREKYNPDNLFKKQNEQNITINATENETSTSIVEYKESILKRLIKKIKSILRIN